MNQLFRIVPSGLSIPLSMITVRELCSLHGNDVTVDGDKGLVVIR